MASGRGSAGLREMAEGRKVSARSRGWGGVGRGMGMDREQRG